MYKTLPDIALVNTRRMFKLSEPDTLIYTMIIMTMLRHCIATLKQS